MRKIIKQYGNSAVIILSSEDLKAYEMKVGDVVELSITSIHNIKAKAGGK